MLPKEGNTSQSGKVINTQELKEIMLCILNDIDVFCQAHSIRYCLAYGSLLGAVRHKGFIPWDDDIDIWMPRQDYMRFMQLYSHPYYKASCAEFTPGWDHYIAKVYDERTFIDEGHGDICGVYVDVFPLDGFPNSVVGKKIHYKVGRLCLNLWSNLHYTTKMVIGDASGISKKIKVIVSRVLCKFLSSERALKWLIKTKMRYSYETSNFIGSLSCGEWTVPKEYMEQMINGEFEGHFYLIPAHYDEWLSVIYGNYMQLPPIEQRVSRHGFTAYWK